MLTPQSFLVTDRLKTNINQPKLKCFIKKFKKSKKKLWDRYHVCDSRANLTEWDGCC